MCMSTGIHTVHGSWTSAVQQALCAFPRSPHVYGTRLEQQRLGDSRHCEVSHSAAAVCHQCSVRSPAPHMRIGIGSTTYFFFSFFPFGVDKLASAALADRFCAHLQRVRRFCTFALTTVMVTSGSKGTSLLKRMVGVHAKSLISFGPFSCSTAACNTSAFVLPSS